MLWQFKPYLLLSLNKDLAARGRTQNRTPVLPPIYVLAVAVVLGLKVLGIVLVSALLIIPTASAKLFTRSTKSLLILSWFSPSSPYLSASPYP